MTYDPSNANPCNIKGKQIAQAFAKYDVDDELLPPPVYQSDPEFDLDPYDPDDIINYLDRMILDRRIDEQDGEVRYLAPSVDFFYPAEDTCADPDIFDPALVEVANESSEHQDGWSFFDGNGDTSIKAFHIC